MLLIIKNAIFNGGTIKNTHTSGYTITRINENMSAHYKDDHSHFHIECPRGTIIISHVQDDGKIHMTIISGVSTDLDSCEFEFIRDDYWTSLINIISSLHGRIIAQCTIEGASSIKFRNRFAELVNS